MLEALLIILYRYSQFELLLVLSRLSHVPLLVYFDNMPTMALARQFILSLSCVILAPLKSTFRFFCGKLRLETRDRYIIHLSIHSGLCYKSIFHPTPNALDKLPVTFKQYCKLHILHTSSLVYILCNCSL
jgi:hypothetical protein